jgi:hypothetical protein
MAMSRQIYPSDFIHIPIGELPSELDGINDWLGRVEIEYEFLGIFTHPETFQPMGRYVIYKKQDETLFRLKWSNRIK